MAGLTELALPLPITPLDPMAAIPAVDAPGGTRASRDVGQDEPLGGGDVRLVVASRLLAAA